MSISKSILSITYQTEFESVRVFHVHTSPSWPHMINDVLDKLSVSSSVSAHQIFQSAFRNSSTNSISMIRCIVRCWQFWRWILWMDLFFDRWLKQVFTKARFTIEISLLNFQGNNLWHAAAPSEQQSKHDLHNFPLHFVLLIVDPHFGPEEFLYSHRPELGREQVCP